MANLTALPKTTVFPSYNLRPVPPLVPGCPDGYLLIALPIITYWIWGGLWYWIEHKSYFPQYRIHTSAEVLKRNRVPLSTILRNVATQQFITTVLGIYLTGEPEQYGREDYDQARWVVRLQSVQAAVPKVFALIGIDAVKMADNLGRSFPGAATFLRGGDYTLIWNQQPGASEPFGVASSKWEITAAWVLYWYLVPAFQFAVAIFIADSWQYFVHRTMHLNNWLYSSSLLFLCDSNPD